MFISCRTHVDVHKRGSGGPVHVSRGRGVKNLIFCECLKWMAPKLAICLWQKVLTELFLWWFMLWQKCATDSVCKYVYTCVYGINVLCVASFCLYWRCFSFAKSLLYPVSGYRNWNRVTRSDELALIRWCFHEFCVRFCCNLLKSRPELVSVFL